MTNDERFELYLKRQEKKKQKERDKRKAEFEKRRVRGYKKYLTKKHREMAEREKEEKKEKERKKLERQKAREAELKKKNKGGRPKKRGPKKKRKSRAKRSVVKAQRPVYNYKVVFCLNGLQNGYFKAFTDVKEAYEAIDGLKNDAKEVMFPRRTIAGGKMAIDEILLLEKNRDGTLENPLLRDEFGRLVEQKTNLPNWIVLDKFRYDVEETFWVYGYDPKTDRKTMPWIYENLLLPGTVGEYQMVRVLVYLNKVVFKYDDGKMDIIFCKTMEEAARFYEKLFEIRGGCDRKVMFIGSYSTLGPKRTALEAELMEKTGWDKRQIQRRKTKK